MIGEIGGQVGGGKLDVTICTYFWATTRIFSLLYHIFVLDVFARYSTAVVTDL